MCVAHTHPDWQTGWQAGLHMEMSTCQAVVVGPSSPYCHRCTQPKKYSHKTKKMWHNVQYFMLMFPSSIIGRLWMFWMIV